MTTTDKNLLIDFENGKLTAKDFLEQFSIDLKTDNNFIKIEIDAAIQSKEVERLNRTIPLIWFSSDITFFIYVLNELLINPNHKRHQQIAKLLQDKAPSPTTVPYIRKALETNFKYFEYTCSESNVIAKWFSWLLYIIGTNEAISLMKEYSNSTNKGIAIYIIGTNEAISLMKEYSNSTNKGIANEMHYRLSKIK